MSLSNGLHTQSRQVVDGRAGMSRDEQQRHDEQRGCKEIGQLLELRNWPEDRCAALELLRRWWATQASTVPRGRSRRQVTELVRLPIACRLTAVMYQSTCAGIQQIMELCGT